MTTESNPDTPQTTTLDFTSSVYQIDYGIMMKLQKDHHKPYDWAHSVLCQGYKIPSDLATKILTDDVNWDISNNHIQVFGCLTSPSSSSSSSPSQ